MTLIKKARRFIDVAAYNRDWQKYVLPGKAQSRGDTEQFRLRNGQIIEVKRDSRFILNEIYLDGVYDDPRLDYSKIKHALDVGANVGVFATYVSSLNPDAQVHCIEPSALNFPILTRNISRNACNAKTYRVALSTAQGTGHLSHNGSSVEYSLVEEAAHNTEEVQCVALDDIFDVCKTPSFDLLKMDIEGHERALLEYADEHWLRRFKFIVVEWHYSWDDLTLLATRIGRFGFDAEPVLLHGHMRFLRALRRD